MVDLWGYCVHNGLTVGGTVVEEQVQHCVIGELAQAPDAGQSDPLDISANKKCIQSNRVKMGAGWFFFCKLAQN